MTTIDKTLKHDPRSTAPDIDRRPAILTVAVFILIGGARRAEGTGDQT